MKKLKNKVRKAFRKQAAVTQGAARKAHYDAGGSPAMWRGSAARLDESTSRARRDKLACRDKTTWQ